MPRISGRSGSMLRVADPAAGRGAQRAARLGLGADLRTAPASPSASCRRSWRRQFLSRPSVSPPRSARQLLALVVGAEQALGHELLGLEAARAATSSGRCSDLQAVDRRPGDVDGVRRAERLGTARRGRPASSRMARAAPPAMTPVPGAAGFSMHAAGAELTPMTGWVMVLAGQRHRRTRFFLASSVPFWMASGTSLALP